MGVTPKHWPLRSESRKSYAVQNRTGPHNRKELVAPLMDFASTALLLQEFAYTRFLTAYCAHLHLGLFGAIWSHFLTFVSMTFHNIGICIEYKPKCKGLPFSVQSRIRHSACITEAILSVIWVV